MKFTMTAGLSVLVVLLCCLESQAATAAPVILAPAGGELYVVGTQQKVRLDAKTRAKSVTVELSRDGGTTFESLGTINNAVKDKTKLNVLAWTVAGAASSNCVIKATASGVAGLTAVFSISAGVTAPISPAQISSAGASTNFLMAADGAGAANFVPPSSVLDSLYVKKPGDTMTGTLTLPADGLAVGAGQLLLSGGNILLGTATGNSKVQIGGSLSLPLTVVNGTSVTAGINDCVFMVFGGNTPTITLPAASTVPGRIYIVKKLSANQAGNNVVITGGSFDTVANNITLVNPYEYRIVISDGSSWRTIAGNNATINFP